MDNNDCPSWKKLLSRICPIIIALISFRIASILLSFIGYFIRVPLKDNFMSYIRIFFYISIGEIIAFIIAIFIYDYLKLRKVVEKNYISWFVFSLILLSFIFIFQVNFCKTKAHILTNYIDVQENQINITGESVLLECYLSDGEKKEHKPFLVNKDVVNAAPFGGIDNNYGIKLYLTEDASKILAEKTQPSQWTKIVFSIDDNDVAKGDILEPLKMNYIIMPVKLTENDAKALANKILLGSAP